MIAVVDLIAWAKENAWGRSATVPDGWIPSELMQNLVYEIKKVEPLHYNPQTDCTEALTLLWIKNMVTDEEFYRIDARLKCISCKWWNDTIVGGSECVFKECTYEPKDKPQYDAEEVAKDINRRVAMGKRLETMSCQECKHWIFTSRWGYFCPLKGKDECNYEPIEDEPQTDCSWR